VRTHTHTRQLVLRLHVQPDRIVTEVLHISIPIVRFAQEIIDSQTPNLICNELGNILDELTLSDLTTQFNIINFFFYKLFIVMYPRII
jgi:hypothetical protein